MSYESTLKIKESFKYMYSQTSLTLSPIPIAILIHFRNALFIVKILIQASDSLFTYQHKVETLFRYA